MNNCEPSQFDTVFVNSRRESFVLLAAFAVFLAWSIGVSYWLGYPGSSSPPDATGSNALRTVMGVPKWVFWGVAVPWAGANVFTFWFCWFYMADDDLGEDTDHTPENHTPENQALGRTRVAGRQIDAETDNETDRVAKRREQE